MVRYHMFADMAELADALDLGSSVHRRAGSSPVTRTNLKSPILSGFFLFWSKIKIRHTHFLLRLCVCLSYAINALLLNCCFQHNKPTVMFNMHLVKILKSTFVKMIIPYHLLHYHHNLFHKCGYLYPYRLHPPRYMPIHCSDRLIELCIYIQRLHLHK